MATPSFSCLENPMDRRAWWALKEVQRFQYCKSTVLKIFFNLLCYSFCGSGIQEHLDRGPQTWGSLTGYHQGIRGAAGVSRLHKRRITHVMVSRPEILAGC